MDNPFFEPPILNSPYECPRTTGSSTSTASRRSRSSRSGGQRSSSRRSRSRRSAKAAPSRRARLRRGQGAFDRRSSSTTRPRSSTRCAATSTSGGRCRIPSEWQVTPETARLLQHWRHHKFSGVRPFFCQVEAVETAIWLTEVAPQLARPASGFSTISTRANSDANPELLRLALKLATGAGKTTVMAMLIAWQTINAVRRPGSKHFTRGFWSSRPA